MGDGRNNKNDSFVSLNDGLGGVMFLYTARGRLKANRMRCMNGISTTIVGFLTT